MAIKEPASGTSTPLQLFKAAVDQLSSLRPDEFIYLSASNDITLVAVDEEELAKRAAANLEEFVNAINEVKKYIKALIQLNKPENVVHFLCNVVYDDYLSNCTKPEKATWKKMVNDKARYVALKIDTTALKARRSRLNTASKPSIEAIDPEVVVFRGDQIQDESIETPFLRLRLRYRSPEALKDPRLNYLLSYAWRDNPIGFGLDSFEIECDTTDIDFLVLQLLQARQLLEIINDEEESIDSANT